MVTRLWFQLFAVLWNFASHGSADGKAAPGAESHGTTTKPRTAAADDADDAGDADDADDDEAPEDAALQERFKKLANIIKG